MPCFAAQLAALVFPGTVYTYVLNEDSFLVVGKAILFGRRVRYFLS